jgi:hypothetical protein
LEASVAIWHSHQLMRLGFLALLALAACSCSPRHGTPDKHGDVVAGIYAASGAATISWGDEKKPTVRRAKPGVVLSEAMSLEVEKGGVALELYEGTSFMWLPAGRYQIKKLKLGAYPADGAKRPLLLVGQAAVRKEIPAPVVAVRYEPPQTGRNLKSEEEERFGSDVSWFFTPHRGEAAEEPEPAKAPTPPPWMLKDKYVHALHRPLKATDDPRMLQSATGVVVVEFLDQATAMSEALKLPLDLGDVRQIVVVDGSAKLSLPSGAVELKSGDIAEITSLPKP